MNSFEVTPIKMKIENNENSINKQILFNQVDNVFQIFAPNLILRYFVDYTTLIIDMANITIATSLGELYNNNLAKLGNQIVCALVFTRKLCKSRQ